MARDRARCGIESADVVGGERDMELTRETVTTVKNAVNQERLLETAMRLVGTPSPTGTAGEAADVSERSSAQRCAA